MTGLNDRAQDCVYLAPPWSGPVLGPCSAVSTRYVPPGGWFYKSLK
jgi:hypothetical protein